MIPYGKQQITQADIDAVVETLQSDYLTQGPKVPEFENLIKDYVGAKFGCAVNSATSALHIACMALDVGPGDTVWTSPVSWPESSYRSRVSHQKCRESDVAWSESGDSSGHADFRGRRWPNRGIR